MGEGTSEPPAPRGAEPGSERVAEPGMIGAGEWLRGTPPGHSLPRGVPPSGGDPGNREVYWGVFRWGEEGVKVLGSGCGRWRLGTAPIWRGDRSLGVKG